MPFVFMISLAAMGLAILSITARTRNRQWYGLVKPLPMILILVLVLTSMETWGGEGRWIFLGLLMGLAGDLLLLSSRGFLAGMLVFLAGHLCYIRAFTLHAGRPHGLLLIPLVIVAVVVGSGLVRRLGRLRIPVLVYMAVLVIMVWTALGRSVEPGGNSSRAAAAAGALLFMVSDSFLAWNRFRTAVPGAHIWILGTYYPAQLLMALSVL